MTKTKESLMKYSQSNVFFAVYLHASGMLLVERLEVSRNDTICTSNMFH